MWYFCYMFMICLNWFCFGKVNVKIVFILNFELILIWINNGVVVFFVKYSFMLVDVWLWWFVVDVNFLLKICGIFFWLMFLL